MKTVRVEVLPYDPSWKEEYEKIKSSIKAKKKRSAKNVEIKAELDME